MHTGGAESAKSAKSAESAESAESAAADSQARHVLAGAVDRLCRDHVTPELLDAASVFPAALWQALEDAGLPLLLTQAGSGWREAQVALRVCAFHAVPAPLGETMLAAALLAHAGLQAPAGPLTVAAGLRLDAAGALHGTAVRVPWGRSASLVALCMNGPHPRAALVPAGAGTVREGCNLAREPRDTLDYDGVAVEARPLEPPFTILEAGALVRAIQMAGALAGVLEQTVRYAGERVQFGRPIGKFQAIQQALAVLASEAAAARTAAAHAAGCMADTPADAGFEIAAAKVRTGDAAGAGAAIAHQALGAMGFTDEHGLHFLTQRLWSWRAEFGSGPAWAEQLGHTALALGGGGLWERLSARGTLHEEEGPIP